VTGPRFDPVMADLAWLPSRGLALIEMALASGLTLLPDEERDPSLTTSLGTGELIRAALDLGAESLVVGIGGSATNDGGIGMASALGWRFLDAEGRPITPNGAGLSALVRIDGSGLDVRLAQVRILAACDVDNPLTGPQGASVIYGPQKGANLGQVARLDAGLALLADLVEGQGRLGQGWLRDHPGAGAAGGLGFGLRAFCGARLRPGAELVLDILDFDARLAGANLVLTAEGWLDGQTLSGKAPAQVAARARRLGIPCIAIAGGLGADLERLSAAGFSAVVSLCPAPVALAEAMDRAEELLADAAEQVLRIFLAGGAGNSRERVRQV
ncbi:MAG: glycerate kinase, partial [Chromatiaceae bacterium]